MRDHPCSNLHECNLVHRDRGRPSAQFKRMCSTAQLMGFGAQATSWSRRRSHQLAIKRSQALPDRLALRRLPRSSLGHPCARQVRICSKGICSKGTCWCTSCAIPRGSHQRDGTVTNEGLIPLLVLHTSSATWLMPSQSITDQCAPCTYAGTLITFDINPAVARASSFQISILQA